MAPASRNGGASKGSPRGSFAVGVDQGDVGLATRTYLPRVGIASLNRFRPPRWSGIAASRPTAPHLHSTSSAGPHASESPVTSSKGAPDDLHADKHAQPRVGESFRPIDPGVSSRHGPRGQMQATCNLRSRLSSWQIRRAYLGGQIVLIVSLAESVACAPPDSAGEVSRGHSGMRDER